MKRIGLLFMGWIMVLSTSAQGIEIVPDYDKCLRTCYSSDGTKVYRYYEDHLIVRQKGRKIPKGMFATQPYWIILNGESVTNPYESHKEEFLDKIKEFNLPRRSIMIRVHISLETGEYYMLEIALCKKAIYLVEKLPLDYLFSLYEGLKVDSEILEHEPDGDDGRYMTYQLFIW